MTIRIENHPFSGRRKRWRCLLGRISRLGSCCRGLCRLRRNGRSLSILARIAFAREKQKKGCCSKCSIAHKKLEAVQQEQSQKKGQ